MSYGADFATADPANAPLDAPLLIGADPLVWGAFLLALLVAAMIGWLVGSGSRSRRGDAAEAIWKAADEAVEAAMKADTDSLPARAADLHRVLRARMGQTLDFARDVGGRALNLEAALNGDAARAEHRSADHPDGPGPDHAPDEDAAPAATRVMVTVGHAPAASPSQPHRPHHPPMTARQRNDALRLAVVAFNDHWRRRSLREAEMRAVVAELSESAPDRRFKN
jgi:hypothetical protein